MSFCTLIYIEETHSKSPLIEQVQRNKYVLTFSHKTIFGIDYSETFFDGCLSTSKESHSSRNYFYALRETHSHASKFLDVRYGESLNTSKSFYTNASKKFRLTKKNIF